MRDPERIKPFLERVEELWQLHPDLRFGQIINLMITDNKDPFYMEEDEWLSRIKSRTIKVKVKFECEEIIELPFRSFSDIEEDNMPIKESDKIIKEAIEEKYNLFPENVFVIGEHCEEKK